MKSLQKATPEEMADELTRRGMVFALIVRESDEETNVYSPQKIEGRFDDLGLFALLRDYLNFIESEQD